MKTHPALDVRGNSLDLLLVVVDDFSPTAAEERGDLTRVFFPTTRHREDAERALRARGFTVVPVDVSDEDWARRSQENLEPITVGRFTIVPANPESRIPNPDEIVIVPSMGFGTGHHATTRLCLEALQTIDLKGASVLDVGTGSGILAIAAAKLGAARVVGVDNDPDAIQAARENLARNPDAGGVELIEGDVIPPSRVGGPWDVLMANLTGAMLIRTADRLAGAIRPGGTMIVSGLQNDERAEVVAAFKSSRVASEREEDRWIGLNLRKT